MDIFERDGGATTADTVHRREEFRQIVSDVQELPETQRTALLLREIDALSYDQIAEAMDTTVPSVKSLLVRARVNLAEASEARLLTCEEVRLELGQVAEGLAKSSPPGSPPSQDLRALPHLQARAAHHLEGPGRDLARRPAGDPAEVRARQARSRRRRRGRRRGGHDRRWRMRGRRRHRSRRRRDGGGRRRRRRHLGGHRHHRVEGRRRHGRRRHRRPPERSR